MRSSLTISTAFKKETHFLTIKATQSSGFFIIGEIIMSCTGINKKTFLTDFIGLGGFSALCYGIYLQFGEAITCMAGGTLLLLYALLAAGGKR